MRTCLDVVKYGLEELVKGSLKEGDVVNIVQFSTDSIEDDVLLESWSYSASDSSYLDVVNTLRTVGGTDLNAGLEKAYEVANRNFNPDKTNRVVILTDAYANRGEIDPEKISRHTEINDMEGIYFSGLGIGAAFNEAFLNELTDAGKGAFYSVITPNDIRKAFGDRFIGLLSVAARETRFRLDFPESLKHLKSASEELSTDMNDVQTTNFSYNTSQFFLESFELGEGDPSAETFKLTVEYRSGDSFETEVVEISVEELLGRETAPIKDAYTVTFLADLVAGKRNCSDFDSARETLLNDYVTDISEEYFSLIEKFCE